jgi:hypothetical protein
MKARQQYIDQVMESMRHAVLDALDNKRRLGQYAVIVENDEILEIGPEEIERRLAVLRKHYDEATGENSGLQPDSTFTVRESTEDDESEPLLS